MGVETTTLPGQQVASILFSCDKYHMLMLIREKCDKLCHGIPLANLRRRSMEEKEALAQALRRVPWLSELSEAHFARVLELAHRVEKKTGEALFLEGDREDYLYILLEGRIALEITVPGRGRVRVSTIEPFDLVGWSSVTPVIQRRTAAARAVLPSRLVALEAAGLQQLCQEDHHFGYLFMQQVANVIASRLWATRLQLLDMFANPIPGEESQS
jgi:CRP-like cAMP-binding protein